MSRADKAAEFLAEYMDRGRWSHAPIWIYCVVAVGTSGYVAIQMMHLHGVSSAEIKPIAESFVWLIYLPLVVVFGSPLLEMALARAFPDIANHESWQEMLNQRRSEVEDAE